MSHMVIFRSAEGKAGYHQTESLDDAIGFVEHLRNQEQVPDARIFRMEEIPIAVKTYYKVEVAPAHPAKNASAPAPAVTSAPPRPSPEVPDAVETPASAPAADKVTVPPQEPAATEPMGPAGGGPNGARFGRFNRS